MIEYVKHIGTAGKVLWGMVVFIVTSTASVFFFISTEVKALEKKMLQLRDTDMGVINVRLGEIATDARDTRRDVRQIKNHLMRIP